MIETILFAAVGVGLLAGLAGATILARFLRRKFTVAAAIVSAADVEHRRSRFEVELDRVRGRGHASRGVVDLAADRAAYADQLGQADTRRLPRIAGHDDRVVEQGPRHAAPVPERESALQELQAGGWNRGVNDAGARGWFG